MNYSKLKYLLFILLLVSCGRIVDQKTLSTIMSFENEEISFPTDLTLVQSGKVYENFPIRSIPHLVFYYDSLECAPCRIQSLITLNSLLLDNRLSKKFDVLPIFSPKKGEGELIVAEAELAIHDLPIYLDTHQSFVNNNPCIPQDPRFHSFLVDISGSPVFVGDPRNSKRLERLFRRTIINISKLE